MAEKQTIKDIIKKVREPIFTAGNISSIMSQLGEKFIYSSLVKECLRKNNLAIDLDEIGCGSYRKIQIIKQSDISKLFKALNVKIPESDFEKTAYKLGYLPQNI